jgi:hypothetical protein
MNVVHRSSFRFKLNLEEVIRFVIVEIVTARSALKRGTGDGLIRLTLRDAICDLQELLEDEEDDDGHNKIEDLWTRYTR